MKRKFFILSFILLISFSCLAVSPTNQQIYLSGICKVWGFLKYYRISKHDRIDWDKEGIRSIRSLLDTPTHKNFNDEVSRLLAFFKPVAPSGFENKIGTSLLDSTLNDSNRGKLISMINHESVKRKKYIKLTFFGKPTFARICNEKKYDENEVQYPEYRLLALFRYWNVIKYFYPTLDSTYHWDQMLIDFIPTFINANTKSSYHIAVLKMNACLRDSHSTYIKSSEIAKIAGTSNYPFEAEFINGMTIISYKYDLNDTSFNVGDTITAINHVPIKTIRDSLAGFLSASTKGYLNNKVSNLLSHGQDPQILLSLNSDKEVAVNKFETKETYWRLWLERYNKNRDVQIIDSVVYFPCTDSYRDKKQLKQLLNGNYQGIIIDFRRVELNIHKALYFIKYIESHFCDPHQPYMILSYPNKKFPGNFDLKTQYTTQKSHKENQNKKIVLLIDCSTQSHLETYVISLTQSNPNIVTIGTQSSGANGVVRDFILPDNIKVSFSSLGSYFPDGTIHQRNGITPDIICERDIPSVIKNMDVQLLKAIEYIRNGNK